MQSYNFWCFPGSSLLLHSVVESVRKLIRLSEYRILSDAFFDRLWQSEAISYEDLTEWRRTACNGLSNEVYWESVGFIVLEKWPNVGVRIWVVSDY